MEKFLLKKIHNTRFFVLSLMINSCFTMENGKPYKRHQSIDISRHNPMIQNPIIQNPIQNHPILGIGNEVEERRQNEFEMINTCSNNNRNSTIINHDFFIEHGIPEKINLFQELFLRRVLNPRKTLGDIERHKVLTFIEKIDGGYHNLDDQKKKDEKQSESEQNDEEQSESEHKSQNNSELDSDSYEQSEDDKPATNSNIDSLFNKESYERHKLLSFLRIWKQLIESMTNGYESIDMYEQDNCKESEPNETSKELEPNDTTYMQEISVFYKTWKSLFDRVCLNDMHKCLTNLKKKGDLSSDTTVNLKQFKMIIKNGKNTTELTNTLKILKLTQLDDHYLVGQIMKECNKYYEMESLLGFSFEDEMNSDLFVYYYKDNMIPFPELNCLNMEDFYRMSEIFPWIWTEKTAEMISHKIKNKEIVVLRDIMETGFEFFKEKKFSKKNNSESQMQTSQDEKKQKEEQERYETISRNACKDLMDQLNIEIGLLNQDPDDLLQLIQQIYNTIVSLNPQKNDKINIINKIINEHIPKILEDSYAQKFISKKVFLSFLSELFYIDGNAQNIDKRKISSLLFIHHLLEKFDGYNKTIEFIQNGEFTSRSSFFFSHYIGVFEYPQYNNSIDEIEYYTQEIRNNYSFTINPNNINKILFSYILNVLKCTATTGLYYLDYKKSGKLHSFFEESRENANILKFFYMFIHDQLAHKILGQKEFFNNPLIFKESFSDLIDYFMICETGTLRNLSLAYYDYLVELINQLDPYQSEKSNYAQTMLLNIAQGLKKQYYILRYSSRTQLSEGYSSRKKLCQ